VFCAFDLLAHEGRSLISHPLEARKQSLQQLAMGRVHNERLPSVRDRRQDHAQAALLHRHDAQGSLLVPVATVIASQSAG
jgi:ATP-dependent DNA ligase